MRISVIASGSGGNCTAVSGGGTDVLIDAGISMRRIRSGLAQAGLALEDIGGVLITHEHSDHIMGLGMLIKHFPDLRIYAPHTVANRLLGMLPDLSGAVAVIPTGRWFSIGALQIMAFHTSHDTDESVGYRIECGGVYGHCTDLGVVTDEVRDALSGADTVLVESNHDEQMLLDGHYPIYLKRRILSERGHLSNSSCAALAAELASKGTCQFILGHLSRENNTPDAALRAVAAALPSGARVVCASQCDLVSVEVRAGCLV